MERESGNGKQLCSCQCHWDLSWLRFGDSRIAVSDVDGMFVVERRGHFLFLETKGIDEPMTQGQRILLIALSRVPRFTVIALYGEKGWPEVLRRMENGEELGVEETSRKDFQRRVGDWYARANGQPPREPQEAPA